METKTRTISIPQSKLQGHKHLCHSWQNKNSCSKNQIQSLLGSLLILLNVFAGCSWFEFLKVGFSVGC